MIRVAQQPFCFVFPLQHRSCTFGSFFCPICTFHFFPEGEPADCDGKSESELSEREAVDDETKGVKEQASKEKKKTIQTRWSAFSWTF